MCLALPGKITDLRHEDAFTILGTVNFDGVATLVNLSYLPEAQIGDYVIVHVGFAISRLDAEAAAKTFAYLQEMEELCKLS